VVVTVGRSNESNLSALAGKTEAMYSLRYSVVLVTLMACVAFTAVGASRNSRNGVHERSTPELAISDKQRGHIFEIVMRISDVPVANGPTPEITRMRCQNKCQCRIYLPKSAKTFRSFRAINL
jgi:hypothetical protein